MASHSDDEQQRVLGRGNSFKRGHIADQSLERKPFDRYNSFVREDDEETSAEQRALERHTSFKREYTGEGRRVMSRFTPPRPEEHADQTGELRALDRYASPDRDGYASSRQPSKERSTSRPRQHQSERGRFTSPQREPSRGRIISPHRQTIEERMASASPSRERGRFVSPHRQVMEARFGSPQRQPERGRLISPRSSSEYGEDKPLPRCPSCKAHVGERKPFERKASTRRGQSLDRNSWSEVKAPGRNHSAATTAALDRNLSIQSGETRNFNRNASNATAVSWDRNPSLRNIEQVAFNRNNSTNTANTAVSFSQNPSRRPSRKVGERVSFEPYQVPAGMKDKLGEDPYPSSGWSATSTPITEKDPKQDLDRNMSTMTKKETWGANKGIARFTSRAIRKEKGHGKNSKMMPKISEKKSHDRKGSTSSSDTAVEKADRIENDPLAHLPPYERDIIERQTKMVECNTGYFGLFRFTNWIDKVVLVFSFLMAIGAGTAMPLMTVILGNLAGAFSQYSQKTMDISKGSGMISTLALYMCAIGVGEFVTVYVAMVGFIYTGQRIAQRTREEYLKAILRQNIGFFDSVGAGEVTKRITSDVSQMQDGISEKVALTTVAASIFFTAFIVGFIKNWYLTLVLTSTVVAIVVIVAIGAVLTGHYSGKAVEAYSPGGSVAQEVISAIRTTTAYGIQNQLAVRYRGYLEKARKWEARKKFVIAMMIAGVEWTVSANDGLAYWQGSRFLVEGKADVSSIVTIAVNILVGAAALGTVGPHIEAFTTAISAGGRIFGTIDRESPLDPMSDEGKRPTYVRGAIELRNVRHIYPSRPDIEALKGISLYFTPGKTTALVGPSGSGKSSIVGLLERFYDPVGGSVLLDGVNTREINLKFLRQNMAMVGQEPTLFNTSIEDNIGYGLSPAQVEKAGPQGRAQMIVDAAKMANAHKFIMQLPDGYHTNVGESGGMMSGGQKQRIAIARAIVGNPRILILDEATSALDTVSESVVQSALDRASKGRTTIVIAHRLSTIKDADNIVVMEEGLVIEQGKHDQLLRRGGVYHALVAAQQVAGGGNLLDSIQEGQEGPEMEEGNRYSFGNLDKIVKRVTAMCAAGPNPQVGLANATTGPSFAFTREVSAALKRRSITSVGSVMDLASPTHRQSMPQFGALQEAHEEELKKTETKKQKNQKKDDYGLWESIKFIARFNKDEKKWLIIGLIWSIIGGCVYPTSVVFQAKCITTLFLPVATQGQQLLSQVSFWASLFFMLSWVSLIAFGGQGISFAYCSERLTYRARDQAFRAILRQDISFFDKEENSTGALTSFLFTETTYLAGMSGATLGAILTFTTTMTASMGLGVGVGWKLGLVCMTCVPILFAGGFLRLWVLARFETRMQKENAYSAGRACEATSAIRTVASLSLETELCDQFHEYLYTQRKKCLPSVLKSSTLYAFSQSALLFSMALGFYYGGHLIINGEYQNLQLFICLSAIIVGAQTAGVIFSFAPDMGKAKHAAKELQTLFDRQPKIDIEYEGGARMEREQVRGAIRLRNVNFNYPTRPEQPILRRLNLSIRPGQFVALVGGSGSGKSTIIQLLERFYDPSAGSVTMDGREISSLNVNDYRSHIALVSQEPAIYDGTIRDNIILGVTASQGEATDAMIEKACKQANIYNFILSLPDGLNTQVGSKGSMLSGGQKQRIAIARALIRNPKVLLLDEATSALDSESEKVVQAALDAASQGRTTIAVAHRLSTIQNADIIYVIDRGQVVEQGTHQELLQQGGKYYELVKLQSLGVDV